MIITIDSELKNPELPIDFRPAFVSLIKAALSKHSNDLYLNWYGDQTGKSKSFTFSVYLPDAQFTKEKVHLRGEFIKWQISTAELSDGIDLYNALLEFKTRHPLKYGNAITVTKCAIQNTTPISESEIKIRFKSPLIVRDHKSDNIDKYLTYDDIDFEQMFKIVVENQLHADNIESNFDVKLVPVSPKKTVVKVFGMHMRASYGVYLLQSDPQLLNYLFQAGLGSRRNLGFGMFEIVN